MRAIKALIIPAVLAFFTNSAYADYHYASHQGSNEYPYTSWATGAHLIQDAVNATDPHDTLYIGPGDWLETVAVEYYDSIAFIGMGMDSTFWYGDTYHQPVLTIDYECSVEGITFEHLQGWRCLYVRVYAPAIVRNCAFIKGIEGVTISGGTSLIENCVFDSCDTGIYGLIVDTITVRNNYIRNSYGLGAIAIEIFVNASFIENNIVLNLNGGSNGIGTSGYCIIRNNIVSAVPAIGTTPPIKANNTVINHHTYRYGIGSYEPGDSILNNTISGYDKAIEVFSGADPFIAYNNFWNNNIDVYGLIGDSIGNISCDPMFVSDSSFYLQAFSPLIDAGAPWILDVDSTRSDIGAYGGPLGESYDYLDLPPAIPDSLWGEIVADTVFLNWRYNTEADFDHYYLHRDTVSGFNPSSFNLIAEPDTSFYIDTDIIPGQSYYYLISAIDNQGNMSDYSEELEVIPTGVWNGMGAEPPRITTIESNYPNPFNSQTTIVYYVANLGPIPAQINVDIYDIVGRKVRRLVDGRKELGIHTVIWDGKNDGGEDCPSGVYFVRISQWNLEISGKARKVVLVR